MKALVLLLAAGGLGVTLYRMARRPQDLGPVRAPVGGTPTFGDRFRRMDLHTSGLAPAADDHEDLLTPPKP